MLHCSPSRLSLVTLLLFGFSALKAAPVPAKHAQVELIAQQAEIAPGSTAVVGVHFMLEKGWHIYWKNPGDSGQPPVFEWQLPAGFSAGEIQWPVPERLQASPELADYGYKDDVLLLVPLKVASGAKGDETAQINLKAKWLICREVCLPDRAELKISIPLSAATREDPSQTQLFASAEQHLPKPLPSGWRAVAVEGKDTLTLKVNAPLSMKHAQFFPSDPGQIDNAAQQIVRPLAKGMSLQLNKSELLLKPIKVLRGVLSLANGRAYEVEAPVQAVRR